MHQSGDCRESDLSREQGQFWILPIAARLMENVFGIRLLTCGFLIQLHFLQRSAIGCKFPGAIELRFAQRSHFWY